MKILSLFDGISCARVALKKAKKKVTFYAASEIDKYAIEISQRNWPDIVHVGDIRKLNGFSNIDLLIGGSPCQDLSIAKANRKGLKGERSGLFWEYVRILKEVKPEYFILENVASMPKEAQVEITMTLFNIPPIMIDAALVSAQRRKRLFWVGKRVGDTYEQVSIEQPEDKGIFLKDILEDGAGKEKANPLCATDYKGTNEKQFFTKGHRNLVFPNDTVFQYRRTYWRETKGGKVPTLTANMGTGGNNVPYVARATVQAHAEQYTDKCPTLSASMGMGGGYEPLLMSEERASELKGKYIDGEQRKIGIRKLTTTECERLQSLPDNYTEGVSNTQRYKALGNAFNVDVVAHILKHIEDK